ncbi:DUF4145 domain-containing protein [Roseovarius atlanticus]|uniref:DUF4145 domain-containing protein n=1 Tax=Roseovarius atlanticus TaxID=1641875 RepID=UPI001C956CE1|nr:DUF4145 domain-containing protein [Roseovarius atlanticus]MBY5987632.1 DUF4145 domain-containing protein [Roseovarius atlanticus]MBY6123023.1 DUF4145 domain-containing protein [Roseovarius atlanticus]MBY6147519.1 DUF4145 domain-containing protein [Roseovarius atlanticus]
MSDAAGFGSAIAHEEGSTETTLAVKVAWFLSETNPGVEVKLASICDFMEEHGIRANINRSRLQKRLIKSKDISAPKGKPLQVATVKRKQLAAKYNSYLDKSLPTVDDSILHLNDFEYARPYVQAIAKQVNGAYQFELFDACAVMMRRLVEVLIIDAYEKAGERFRILDSSGNYLMMNGLINSLRSGDPFKLSRNAPKALEQLKELGDNAAHSRTYITKRLDIEGFAPSFRRLVSEVSLLS